MKVIMISLIFGILSVSENAQKLPLLKVSNDQKYMTTQDDKPFFWLGGTAWKLIHRLNRQEVDKYITERAKKGFTVIQAVILAEMDGLMMLTLEYLHTGVWFQVQQVIVGEVIF